MAAKQLETIHILCGILRMSYTDISSSNELMAFPEKLNDISTSGEVSYPLPPSISNGDLPVALETAGGLIVIFPGIFDTDGGEEVVGFCTVLFTGGAEGGGETGAVIAGDGGGAEVTAV